MAHLYSVYAVDFTAPEGTTETGILLTPARVSLTNPTALAHHSITFLRHSPESPSPSTSNATSTSDASTDLPVIKMELVGVCQDQPGFVKTAQIVARFHAGGTSNASQMWAASVLSSASEQGKYKPMDLYTQDQEAASRREKSRYANSNQVQSSSTAESSSGNSSDESGTTTPKHHHRHRIGGIFRTRRMAMRSSLVAPK